MERRSLRPVLYGGLAYFAVGVSSAVISNPVASRGLQATLRLVALFLGLMVFLLHIRYEISVQSPSIRMIAFRSAVALAIGTFLLALYAVLYAILSGSRSIHSILLALLVWPLVTGALGFLASAVISAVVRKASSSR